MADAAPWLLLIHQIPPKPDYFRVKVRRRLHRLGAVALKNSVYVLPNADDALEDFQWLAREIVADGGEATVCEASFVDVATDGEVRQLFHTARDAEYREVAAAAQGLAQAGDAARTAAELPRLARRLAEIARVDFLGAPARREAEDALAEAERSLAAREKEGEGEEPAYPAHARSARGVGGGRTWVTRRGVFIDRMASAWLIRRFLDPEARLVFVDPKEYRHRAGELRFDMFDAEYTHEGDRCTFETLLARLGGPLARDRALRAIAEIVHDVDCKDERFGREETAGVAALVAGIARAYDDDAVRVERAAAAFDDLYAGFARRRP
jgi:hypothetical protein